MPLLLNGKPHRAYLNGRRHLVVLDGQVISRHANFYSLVKPLYDFNADVQGWVGNAGDAVAHETAAPLSGVGSLRITRSWSSGTDSVRASSPLRAAGERDVRGTNVDAIGVRVLVPAGAPGTGWQARLHVENTAGAVVSTSSWTALSVGVVARLWAPQTQTVLSDVAAIHVQVSANGVNTSQGVIVDDVALGASGALYPGDPSGGSDLWSTSFATADPKAELHIESGVESGAANLTFPTVSGAKRARVAWPTVGVKTGYAGRARVRDLPATPPNEGLLEYEVLLPSATLADLANLDMRLPSLAGLPEGQPGTYTSLDGTTRADSWSAPLHLKAGSPPWGEQTLYAAEIVGHTLPDVYGFRFPLRSDLVLTADAQRTNYWTPPADKAVQVRTRVKANSPATADGELDVWVDGKQYLRVRQIRWADPCPPVSQILHALHFTTGGAPRAGATVDVLRMRLASVASQVAPGAFTLTAGTPTATSIPLTWTASANASAYEVRRGDLVVATGLAGTSYTDTGLSPATVYPHTVVARNSVGERLSNTTTTETAAGAEDPQAYLTADTFDGPGLSVKWASTSGTNTDNGVGHITYATTYPHRRTNALDWRGKRGSIRWVNAPTASGALHIYSARIDSSNNYEWILSGATGKVVFQKTVGGTLTHLWTETYDPALYAQVAIRESAGQVIAETSSDGVTWVERYRETAGINMAVATERLMAYAPSGVSGTFDFDDNNSPGTAPPPNASTVTVLNETFDSGTYDLTTGPTSGVLHLEHSKLAGKAKVGSGILALTGNTPSTSYGGYYRIYNNKRFGGPGTSVVIDSRVRSTAIHTTDLNGTIPSVTFGLKSPEDWRPQDDVTQVYGGKPPFPAYIISRFGVGHNGRCELARNRAGDDFDGSGRGYYWDGMTFTNLGYTAGTWVNATVRWDFLTVDSIRVRYWHGTTLVFDWQGHSPIDRPGFLQMRIDGVDAEWDNVRIRQWPLNSANIPAVGS